VGDAALTEALAALADTGVPTLGQLQATFPDAARDALRVARETNTDDGWGGRFLDFLAAQTGARPLTPLEGDTPDAILSRADFALSEGRVADAVAELETLDPAVAHARPLAHAGPRVSGRHRRAADRTGGMMLWSLTKVVLFVAIIAALALGAGLLSETGQALRIIVAGWEFTIGPVQAVVLGVLLFLAVWLLLKVLGLLSATFHFLNGDETAISRYFDRNRERKGYQARCRKA
jgi:hypothetical protein